MEGIDYREFDELKLRLKKSTKGCADIYTILYENKQFKLKCPELYTENGIYKYTFNNGIESYSIKISQIPDDFAKVLTKIHSKLQLLIADGAEVSDALRKIVQDDGSCYLSLMHVSRFNSIFQIGGSGENVEWSLLEQSKFSFIGTLNFTKCYMGESGNIQFYIHHAFITKPPEDASDVKEVAKLAKEIKCDNSQSILEKLKEISKKRQKNK